MGGSPGNVETRYDVVLVSAGTRPRRVARTIAAFTDLDRAKALELLRRAPVLILQGAAYATAEGARQELESQGARVEVRAYEVEVPKPAATSRARWRGWQVALVIAAILIFLVIMILASFASALSSLSGICNPDCL